MGKSAALLPGAGAKGEVRAGRAATTGLLGDALCRRGQASGRRVSELDIKPRLLQAVESQLMITDGETRRAASA